NVTGSVTLAGALLDINTLAFVPAIGDTFTIINNQGTDPISGTFFGLPQGATFTADDSLGNPENLQISYTGGTGNDVTLSVIAVPEPVSFGLLAVGSLALLRRRAKR